MHVDLASFIATPTVRGLARLVRQRDDELSPIRGTLRFNETGTKPPLVLLNGAFGGGNYARRLALRLGSDQPLVSFAPHGLDASFVPATVEEMADEFIARIDRLYPTGPLRLAGYSYAGTVALEAARKLTARGRLVDRVIVIGGDPINVKFAWIKRLARRIGLSPLTVRRWTQAVRIRLGRAKPSPVPQPDSFVSQPPFRAYIEAMENFIPRRFDGHVHLIWPTDQESTWDSDARKLWLSIARDVTVANVPGDHFSSISKHVDALSDAFIDELARLR